MLCFLETADHFTSALIAIHQIRLTLFLQKASPFLEALCVIALSRTLRFMKAAFHSRAFTMQALHSGRFMRQIIELLSNSRRSSLPYLHAWHRRGRSQTNIIVASEPASGLYASCGGNSAFSIDNHNVSQRWYHYCTA